MTTVTLRRAANGAWGVPGTWLVSSAVAVVACPRCGGSMQLRAHLIAADGSVSPSVVCPYGCGWHEVIVLEGWRP